MAMRQDKLSNGSSSDTRLSETRGSDGSLGDFVLEKNIFSNIFEKDIRRVFIYKKAERLAKAIHMISPAFVEATSLRNRLDAVAVGLIDAAIRPPATARTALSRELLTLSSVLSIAQAGGLLSAMNADLIAHEAQTLLQEVAAYEEPRLFLDEAPTIASLAKNAPHDHARRPVRAAASSTASKGNDAQRVPFVPREAPGAPLVAGANPGGSAAGPASDVSDMVPEVSKGHFDERVKDRRDAVLSVIRERGEASIKDISTRFRNVSEKTIQRELVALVQSGIIGKRGERRWSVYFLS